MQTVIRLIMAAFICGAFAGITQGAFEHPGCLSTQADLDRMTARVAAGEQPWKGSWDILVNNTNWWTNHTPEALETVCCDSGTCGSNFMNLARDAHRAYQLTLRYHGDGSTWAADKAVEILNAWASTHTGWNGNTNVSLRAGIYGYQMACAAELMRNYSGWQNSDFQAFQNYMLDQFLPINEYFLYYKHGTVPDHYWSNWTQSNVASMMAIGVLCDRRDIFDDAVNYFKGLKIPEHGSGTENINNSVVFRHPNGLGQWQESGRDQGHSLMGPQLTGVICEIAWNQGLDLYGYRDNLFLSSVEYISRYNTWQDVPFTTYVYVHKHPGSEQYWVQTNISSGGRGQKRPGWDLVYNHYVNRLGNAAPYTRQYAETTRPEGGGFNYGSNSGGFDGLGFTTLTHSCDPIASGAVPSNLLPYVEGRQITLSWAGSAYADSYNVKRSTTSGGSYTPIATVGPENLFYVDPGLTAGTTYYYVVSANMTGGETANSAELAVTATSQLHGTVIGTDGSWSQSGADKYKAFDDSTNSYFDPPSGDAWAGLDLGSEVSAVITGVKYAPREGFASRMAGQKIQGSNDGSTWTTLHTITTRPPENVLTYDAIDSGAAYRYFRIYQGSSSWLNLSEVDFYGNYSSSPTVPTAPGDLSVTTISSSQIDLSWTSVVGADSYNVKRAASSDGPYTIIAHGNFTHYSDSGLKGGKTYYYLVSALNSAGQSARGSKASATTPIQLVNIAPGEAVSANDDNAEWNEAEGVASAFDDNVYTKWYTGGNTGSSGWLQVDLGAGNQQVVIRYELSSANDVPDRDPKNWQLLGSNNGSSWTTLDSRNNESFSSRHETRTYTISNSTSYRFYRLNILSNYSGSGADGIQLAELALMAVVPTFTTGTINNLDAIEARDYAGNPLSHYVTAPGGTFSKAGGPDWLTAASNGALSGIPLHRNVGENMFTFRVEGPQELFDTVAMTIQVANACTGTQGLEDLVGLASQWLLTDGLEIPACGADLDGDADVDLSDLARLGSNWQNGIYTASD